MSLQLFIKRVSGKALGLLAAALLLAACGGSPSKPDSESQPQEMAETTVTAPSYADVPPAAMTLFEQATFVMASGDYLDAELRFKDFLMRFPDYPGAHTNLAIIHAENGDNEAAQAAIDAALALDPNYAPALNQQGMLLRKTGNFLEAEAAYLKAVTASPNYALAHYNLGVLNELYLQRLETALQHFEQYQSIVGEDEQVERWIADLKRRVAAGQG
jgi:tetratricopeptide (TPR) repeat protein